MSSYLNFYLRVDDKFIPLDDFSRSTEMYKVFYTFAPYEKIRAVTEDVLQEYMNRLQGQIELTQDAVANYREEIESIGKFNNSVEEKLLAIENVKEKIVETNEMLEELTFDKYFLETLYQILETNRFLEENKRDISNMIYVGIECGNPTLNDIKE